jgi:hypothetical protein
LEKALGLAGAGEESQRAADSRITDADVAAESTEMVKAQIQTQTAGVALTYLHADAARTLQLITESRVDTSAPALAAESAPAPATQTGGASVPASGSGGGSSFASAPSFSAISVGGYSESPVTPGYSAAPVTPGFSASPVTPGFSSSPVTPGFAALPVIGSGGGGATGGGLSSNQMLSMIAGSLA